MIEDIQSSSSFFSVAPHEETFTPNHRAGAKIATLEIGWKNEKNIFILSPFSLWQDSNPRSEDYV